MSDSSDNKVMSGAAVARGLAALGVRTGVTDAAALGLSPGVVNAISEVLSLEGLTAADHPSDLRDGYDLIIAGDELATPGLAETRQRVAELTTRLKPDGELAVWLPTLAAPLRGERPSTAYHALLFPESAAAGVMGLGAEATALSVSAWMMMFYASGLECVAQAGIGETPLPERVAKAHAARLAVFDPGELQTGRFLARFRRRETSL